MKSALKDARVNAADVGYCNAHGTSTTIGDETEVYAIRQVFGDLADKLPVSATKSMTGHLLGASAGIEAVATALTLDTGVIHPTINYETPDPKCNIDCVPNVPREVKVNIAISNSFGFGGHNATLVLGKFTRLSFTTHPTENTRGEALRALRPVPFPSRARRRRAAPATRRTLRGRARARHRGGRRPRRQTSCRDPWSRFARG